MICSLEYISSYCIDRLKMDINIDIIDILNNFSMFLGYEYIVIFEALCFDVAQGRMNGAPNETRIHSCRFASQAC